MKSKPKYQIAKQIIATIIATSPSLCQLGQAQDDLSVQEPQPVNPACLVKSDKFAGSEVGEFSTDRQILTENMNTDYRLNGFQICSTEPRGKGQLTAFRLITAPEFGEAVEYQDGTPIGPAVAPCNRYAIANAAEDPIVSITLHVNEEVLGITIKKENTTGTFGQIDLRDSVTWFFDPLHPLVGAYGYTGLDYISGMGFITYDLESDCQNTPIPGPEEDKKDETDDEEGTSPVEDKDKVTDEDKDNSEEAETDDLEADEEEEEKGGVDIVTIGIYTGGVLIAILIVFVIVMMIEKCRRKHKRITEVVEFKPVDLDKHFKGVEERNQLARSKALEARKAKPKPQRTPVPIM